MDGIKGLVGSKKAISGGIIVICATVGWFMGRMTTDQWIELSTWVFTVYAGAETASSVTAIIKTGKNPAPSPSPVPAAEEDAKGMAR